MTEKVRCMYLFCHALEFISLIAASIFKPDWLIGFIVLGVLGSISLTQRITEWNKHEGMGE